MEIMITGRPSMSKRRIGPKSYNVGNFSAISSLVVAMPDSEVPNHKPRES